ncbi:hypothetical protein KP509_28G036800 [Ceratopteris richardii]|uniref:F-box domain-containing protein n=1 Tax=Ceratopteris richardii TaxID=49495 RepID=A0A8T2RCY0_CERRI|nr:hypothetical protein KP509_28G036800 [Ceratopteris richardii]
MLSGSKKGFWADGSDESRKQQRSAEDGDEEGNGRWRSSSSPGCQTYGCSGSDKNESARIYGSGSTSTSQRTALVSVIPEDVFVFKILPLLPLLQIFKLRCVCRSWYALLPRVLFGSKVDFADAKEAPWLVFARVIRSHYEPKDFTRELLAYIPASGRWFSFPLPFQSSPPSSSSSSEGWVSEARLHNSSTHYDISSLLGPCLQNTHPCYQKRTTASTHPLMASARGLVCTLVYNKNVFVDAQRLPLPSPRSWAFPRLFYLNEFGPFTDKASAFHWASLLLFNPLTGKALVEPLPPDPILSRVPLERPSPLCKHTKTNPILLLERPSPLCKHTKTNTTILQRLTGILGTTLSYVQYPLYLASSTPERACGSTTSTDGPGNRTLLLLVFGLTNVWEGSSSM